MLVKVLGLIDFVVAGLFIMMSWKIGVPDTILMVFAIIMFAKSIFIFFGDIASGFDLISGIVLILAMNYNLPIFLFMIVGFLELQKGFFSLLA